MASYVVRVEGGISYPDPAKPDAEKHAKTGSVVDDLDPKWVKDGLALGYIEESKASTLASVEASGSADKGEN